MFTENVREAFRTMAPMKSIWLKLYNWTRLPFMPIYGGFPVKLVTHLGSPLLPSPGSSPQQLQKEVKMKSYHVFTFYEFSYM